MSVENLKEYARRCANEPELRAKAKAIGLTDMDAHMQQARGLELDWTQSDLVDFRREAIDADGDIDDLSEEELELVAGGAITTTAAVLGSVVGVAVVGAAAGSAAAGGTAAAGDGGW